MRMSCKTFTVLVAAAVLCIAGSASSAFAAEGALESSMEMDFNAIAAIVGIRVVAAGDIQGNSYTEDYGPAQVLEIIRPDQGPITVGRLMTSCSCLRATMEKRAFGQGERAFIEVRNVRATPPDGATYLVFARLNQPYQATLQHELFVKSVGQGAAAAVPAAPVREPVRAPGFEYDQIAPYMPSAGK
jgi:hypothetical protein